MRLVIEDPRKLCAIGAKDYRLAAQRGERSWPSKSLQELHDMACNVAVELVDPTPTGAEAQQATNEVCYTLETHFRKVRRGEAKPPDHLLDIPMFGYLLPAWDVIPDVFGITPWKFYWYTGRGVLVRFPRDAETIGAMRSYVRMNF